MNEKDYCICIMTFDKRLEQVTKFVKALREQTNADIYLGVNGPYKGKFNEEYRKKILELCAEIPNLYCFFSLKFRSATFTFNQMMINSGHQHCILSNDDIEIQPGFIDEVVDHYFNKTNQAFLEIFGFSTFFVNKDFMDKWGWFNEFYLGLGFEDHEFAHRRDGFYSQATSMTTSKIRHMMMDNPLAENGANVVGSKSDNLDRYHKFNQKLWNMRMAVGNQIKSNGKTALAESQEADINFRPFERFYMDNYERFW